MNLQEAYNKVFEVIKELEQKNIQVRILPSNEQNNLELIEKYGYSPNRLKPEKWVHVAFKPKDKEEKELIYKKSTDLLNLGISFDTGSGWGMIDWEIDWSFHIE